jgi:hypothetical protein
MNLYHSIFSGLGLSALLFCAVSSVQAMPKSMPKNTPTPIKAMAKPSLSLGGPITPSQPNFFGNSNGPVLPASVNSSLGSGFASQPIPSAAEKSPIPLVGDPPRPTRGGIINIKTN